MIKRGFKLYIIIASQYLKRLMEYKIDFLIGAVSFLLGQLVNILFIYIIFSQIPDLEGWTYEQILFIYGFSLLPKGLDHLLCDNMWMIGYSTIERGEFDRYLLRPISTLFQVLVERLQVDAFGELILGIVLVSISASKLGHAITVLDVVLFIAIIPFAALIYTAIKTICSSLSFWVKRSGNITHMFYMMNDFAKYPVGIYNRLIRSVITYIVPFAFTAFYPASYFITHENPLFNLGGTVIISVALFAIACFIWSRGTRAYESAGS